MRPLLLGFLLVSFVPPALATPSFRLSWDDCNVVITNRNWSGPGTYALVLSGTGFDGSYTQFDVPFLFDPLYVAPAWDFATADYHGGTICHSASLMTASQGPSACPAYPATALFKGMYKGATRADMYMDGFLDPAFVPDPAQRYTLMRLEFDHSQSAEGVQAYPACGGVEEPMCVAMHHASLRLASGYYSALVLENSYVTWQDPSNLRQCPNATPAAPRTWGALKAQYR